MVQESVKRQSEKPVVTEGKKTVKITVSELNEKVRGIVQKKLQEMKNNVPSMQTIQEGLVGKVTSSTPVVKEALVLSDKEAVALSYASILAKKGGSVDSPKALKESVEALKAVKSVVSLSEEEVNAVGPVLKEWADKHDDSISDTAKALAERLAQ
jgi:hypothetical protein